MLTADATVEEAQLKLRRLVEFEKGRCGGHVPTALQRVSENWGIDPGPVNSLWNRRLIKSVKGHILDRLRQADAILKEYANHHRRALEETAATLERHHHPAARLARLAADAAREEVEAG